MVLAFDVGTSSLRTALFDSRARRIVPTTAQQAYRLLVTADGGAEHAAAVLEKAARSCLQQTLRRYRSYRGLRARRIVAVGASCFWHSLLGVSETGAALTPVYTWADSRCRADARRLREEFSEKLIQRRTGCMLRSSFWPAKLVWLRRTQPRLFAQVARWMSQ